MRSLAIGLIIGLVVGVVGVALFFADSLNATGAAIGSTGSTITLPAGSLDRSDLEVDLRVEDGFVSPRSITVERGRAVSMSVLAVSAPASLIIPDAGVATPLLSARQVHTFSFRLEDPGSYELICRPCGSMQSLDSIELIVT
ncbi:MAG: hypothetical protein ACMXYM_02530 [Candidatus Woesearchaeota archaeon]